MTGYSLNKEISAPSRYKSHPLESLGLDAIYKLRRTAIAKSMTVE